ncbi:Tetratricopeptide-like helical [Penicillium cf. viridicatum]|uniref:Autophagy-related protein 1 n=1 Tax=Penicillium cf. viridicatum TaxID=2972119 RepID=A0A9W9SY23_9EURO|nr:Tetratricopeptide-like helical [Penicillium cf. viridicatum]
MDTFTELVEKKRLFHRFQHPYTVHVSLDLSHDGEHQPEVQKWRREQGIGAGGGGKVFLEVLEIQPSEAGQPAKYKFRAVKEIARSGVTDQTYKRELKAIFNFSQKKYNDLFVESYGWFHTDDTVFIAMEYFKNGDLGQHLQHLGRPLPVLEAQQIAIQILEGLYFMHSEGFTHRALKPANLLVVSFRPWRIKIGDFGLCKQVLGDLTSLRTDAGTPLWAAPEYFYSNERTGHYTSAVDIWSFKVIVFYMLTGKRPFLGTVDVIEYGRGQAKFPESTIDTDKNGADCTIASKPEDRLSAYRSLEHPWLRAYREGSSLLNPIGEVSSTSTSLPLLASALGSSEKETSKAPSGIKSSSASGSWGFLDETQPEDVTVMPIRNGTNSTIKSPTLPVSGSKFNEKKTLEVDSNDKSSSASRTWGFVRGFINRTQRKEASSMPIKKASSSTFEAPPLPRNSSGSSEKETSKLRFNDKSSSISGTRGFINQTQPKEASFVLSKEASSFTFTAPTLPHNGSGSSEKQTSKLGSDDKPSSVSTRIKHFDETQSRVMPTKEPPTKEPSYSPGKPTDDCYVDRSSSDIDSKSSIREGPIACVRGDVVGLKEDMRASPVSSPLYLGTNIWLKRNSHDAKIPEVDKLRHEVGRGKWAAVVSLARTLIEQAPSHPSYGDFQCCLGFGLFFNKEYKEAEFVFHKAQKLPTATRDFTICVMLAEVVFRQGRQDESISFVRLALEVQLKDPFTIREHVLGTQYVLGDLLGRDLKTQSEAVNILTDVIAQSRTLYGSNSQETAYAFASLADCYSLSEDWGMAAHFLRKAIATKAYSKGLDWKYNLLGCYGLAGQNKDAVIYFRKDVKRVTKEHGTHNIHLLESQFLLWKSLMSWEWEEEAHLLFENIGRLRRELRVENEVWPAWLERLNHFVDDFEDYKKRLSEEEKSTRDKRTPISTTIEDWKNPFPTDPFRFIGQRRGGPKVRRK